MKHNLKFTITPRSSDDGFDRIDIDLPEVRVGNVRCHFLGEKVIVYSIQVFPEFQGNDFGTTIINMLKRNHSIIIADRVRFTAREFWTKMGFKELPDGNWEYRRPVIRPVTFTK